MELAITGRLAHSGLALEENGLGSLPHHIEGKKGDGHRLEGVYVRQSSDNSGLGLWTNQNKDQPKGLTQSERKRHIGTKRETQEIILAQRIVDGKGKCSRRCMCGR